MKDAAPGAAAQLSGLCYVGGIIERDLMFSTPGSASSRPNPENTVTSLDHGGVQPRGRVGWCFSPRVVLADMRMSQMNMSSLAQV